MVETRAEAAVACIKVQERFQVSVRANTALCCISRSRPASPHWSKHVMRHKAVDTYSEYTIVGLGDPDVLETSSLGLQ